MLQDDIIIRIEVEEAEIAVDDARDTDIIIKSVSDVEVELSSDVAPIDVLVEAPGVDVILEDPTTTFSLDNAPDVIILAAGNIGPEGPDGPEGPRGYTGAQGPPGDVGPPGGAMLSAFWDYNVSVTPPPANGQLRTAPDPVVAGQEMTMWISNQDDKGLYYEVPAVVPGDGLRLRGTSGAVQNCTILSWTETVPGLTGYRTVQLHVDSLTAQIKGTAKVEVTVIKPPAQGPPGEPGYPDTTGHEEDILMVPPEGGSPIWAEKPAGGGVDYIGDYSITTPYKKGDVVHYNGADYLAVNDSTGVTPPPKVPNTVPTTIGAIDESVLTVDVPGQSPVWKAVPYPAPPPAQVSQWVTGDTKISAQTATHPDPLGGTWYLADGSAVPPANTALVALLGTNFPDPRGGALVMTGVHADVNAIGKKDPAALADRRIAHKHVVVNPSVNSHKHGGGVHGHGITDPTHGHTGYLYKATTGPSQAPPGGYGAWEYQYSVPPAATGITVNNSAETIAAEAPGTSGGTVGPQAAGTPTDSPSFTVVGNLFYHS